MVGRLCGREESGIEDVYQNGFMAGYVDAAMKTRVPPNRAHEHPLTECIDPFDSPGEKWRVETKKELKKKEERKEIGIVKNRALVFERKVTSQPLRTLFDPVVLVISLSDSDRKT